MAPSPSDSQGDDGHADSPDPHLPDPVAIAAARLLNNQQNAAPNADSTLSFPSGSTTTNSAVANSNPRYDSSTTPTPQFPPSQVQFRAHTIAPSPPATQSPPSTSPPRRPASQGGDGLARYQPSPLGGAGPGGSTSGSALGDFGGSLRLQTDLYPGPPLRTDSLNSNQGLSAATTSSSGRPSALSLQHKSSTSSLKPISRTPSLRTGGYHGFGTHSAASSTVPSPIISAMGDVTPLPSPLLSGDSPGPWKRLGRSPPRDVTSSYHPAGPESVLVTSNGESLAQALASHSKRRTYAELVSGGPGGHGGGGCSGSGQTEKQPHTRNRSISEYIPDPLNIPRRMVTVSGSHIKAAGGPDGVETALEPHMRREPHLSEARGLTPIEKPPTPPPSESSLTLTDSAGAGKKRYEYFEAHGRGDQKKRRWRAIKQLGQGTFSTVMLATSQITPSEEEDYEQQASGMLTPEPQPQYDRKTLVAVKICEHGPKGGASEDRVEMSLKRELEIMQSIHHPSLVHLKAWNIEPTRAILVLSYCPGGDLFDVASTHRDVLTPPLLRRIFAELVGAVRYLHERHIVHRDIKLENVLVNLPPSELADRSMDWATYPYSVTTLTDLGLSRRVADDEKLETRCGSDDYAAPEVIMGQPYDGRATDAWSLGVLLYALLEGRLPFDPHPGASDAHRLRSRTSHRIARVEWRWIEYGAAEDTEDDHEADPRKFEARGLLGAMEITEGLLKRARSRWTLDRVAATEWVRGAVRVDGGIRFREEEEGEEVS